MLQSNSDEVLTSHRMHDEGLTRILHGPPGMVVVHPTKSSLIQHLQWSACLQLHKACSVWMSRGFILDVKEYVMPRLFMAFANGDAGPVSMQARTLLKCRSRALGHALICHVTRCCNRKHMHHNFARGTCHGQQFCSMHFAAACLLVHLLGHT